MKMKWFILPFTFLCLLMFNHSIAQTNGSFETTTCTTDPFLNNCVPEWIPASGFPLIVNSTSAFPAFEGSKYAKLVIWNSRFSCALDPINSDPDRGSGLILNYNFTAGETYTIRFALKTRDNFGNLPIEKVKVILTNGLAARGAEALGRGDLLGCKPNDVLPPIPNDHETIFDVSDYSSSGWQLITRVVTPKENYSQLYFRGSNIFALADNYTSTLYLDAVSIHPSCALGSGCWTQTDLTACADEGEFGSIGILCPNAVSFNWTLPPGSNAQEFTTGQNSIITQAEEGTYSVTITYNNSCTEIRTFTIAPDCAAKLCPLEQPTNLRCLSVLGNRQVLWDPVRGASAYDVTLTPNDRSCCRSGSTVSSAPVRVTGTSYPIPSSLDGTCFSVRITAVCPDGPSLPSDPFCFNSRTICSSIGFGRTNAPKDVLQDAIEIRPNPADQAFTLEFTLQAASNLTLDIFDAQGKQVRHLEESDFEAGTHAYKVGDLGNLAEGIYMVRIQTLEGTVQKKVILSHR